jgi:hypothetical protein
MNAKPRVYLAGKISKQDWRFDLFPIQRVGPYDPLEDYPHTMAPEFPTPQWGSQGEGLRDGFQYGGPYFLGCDHGCMHGRGSHGLGAETGQVCIQSAPTKTKVIRWCLQWIQECDAVFCWLDSPTAYGTLTELGYAYALNKPVFIAVPFPVLEPPTTWYQDLWFPTYMADFTSGFHTPLDAWEMFVRWYHEDRWRHPRESWRRYPKPSAGSKSYGYGMTMRWGSHEPNI